MQQIIIGGYNGALINSSSPSFNTVMGGYTWVAGVGNISYQVVPTAGVFSRLSVQLSGTPGTNPYVFTLYVNGSSTSLTVTISATGTTAIDTTDTVSVNAGDQVALECSYSTAPTNTPTAWWSLMFQSNTANESILMGIAYTSNTTTGYTCCSQGAEGLVSTEARVYSVAPTNGVMKKLYVFIQNSVGTGTYTTALRVGAVTQALSVGLTYPTTTGSDTSDTVSISAGNLIDMAFVPSGSPTNTALIGFGMVFSPTIDGESLILGNAGPPSNSATGYIYPQVTDPTLTPSTPESGFYQGGQAPTGNMVLKKLYAYIDTAPGGSAQWALNVRDSGNNSGVSAVISGSNTTGNDITDTYTCNSFDLLDIAVVPTGSPAALSNVMAWGLVCYIAVLTGRGISAIPLGFVHGH